jgi:hypothetical protein
MRMPRHAVGRISFGVVEGPFSDRAENWALLQSVLSATGTRVERYNREWRLGPIQDDGTAIMGRIGYERQAGTAQRWDEKRQDFREAAVLEGQTASYAVARSSLRIAFQFRPPNIKRRSFTAAFQDLLNESTGDDLWRVDPELDEEDFDTWRSEVDRVEELRITVRRPNPRYRGDRVRDVIEGTRSQIVTLIARAEAGESVNLDDPLLLEMIEHAQVPDKDYGHFTAKGITSEDRLSVYDSEADGAPDEVRVRLSPGTKEVPWETVRQSLDPGTGGPSVD